VTPGLDQYYWDPWRKVSKGTEPSGLNLVANNWREEFEAGLETTSVSRLPFGCYNLREREKQPKQPSSGPEILRREPVFPRTRVPLSLIDYLEGGETLDQFLEQYPSVSRELAIAIEEARSVLVSQLKMKVLVDECAPEH